MKTKKKMGGVLSLALLTLTFAATFSMKAAAVGLQDLQTKEANKIGMAELKASNNAECMNLGYSGASSEAVVTISSFQITAYAPAGTADTTFGTSGTYLLSSTSYDTMGELCDAVEALSSYTCRLLACKRDDATYLLRDQTATSGTNDLKATGGATILLDTGGVAALTDVFVERIGITPLSGRRVQLKSFVGNANVIGTCKVYGKLRKFEGATDGVTRNDTTLVWSAITADDTDLTVDFTNSGRSPLGLEFATDAHVVISCGNGTGVQAAANQVQAFWNEY